MRPLAFAVPLLLALTVPSLCTPTAPLGSQLLEPFGGQLHADSRPRARHVSVGALGVLGSRAASVFAPSSHTLSALIEVQDDADLERLHLARISERLGSYRGTREELLALANNSHVSRMELAPPLHTLLDQVGKNVRAADVHATGLTGKGTLIGVADTGIDVTNPEFKDADGKSRVRWLLDFSQKPRGVHTDIEAKVKITSGSGELGAVWSGTEIDDAILNAPNTLSRDADGHGTHVSGIAASNGGFGANASPFIGMAPEAELVVVHLPHSDGAGIEIDDLVRAVTFIYDRGDFEKKPTVINMSLGTDFGAHDGSNLWEKAITSFIGDDKPGRAMVAAAGNSGSVADAPIHQSVYVSSGSRMQVPVVLPAAATNGRVQIWINFRPGASMSVGLDGPDGAWISQIGDNDQAGRNQPGYSAGVIVGQVQSTPIPVGSHSGIVLWTGAFPAGTYNINLEGQGIADLYLEAAGDFAALGPDAVGFAAGVREGTINLPGANPAVISVGCTVNRPKWHTISGIDLGLQVPLLDRAGALPRAGTEPINDGDVCYFSSAGPNALGVPKPDIAAPGAIVESTLSNQAKPGSPFSIFTSTRCPKGAQGQTDNRCLLVDEHHAVSSGTSMSSPVIAGLTALLFQKDPTLTQSQVRALLQGGAHRFRGAARFPDQAGPGEADIVGSLLALERSKTPSTVAPDAAQSWLTPSDSYLQGDGQVPITVTLLLRGLDGSPVDAVAAADIVPSATLSGVASDKVQNAAVSAVTKRGPGVYYFTVAAPPGAGGSFVTLGATLRGAPLAATRMIPVAADGWRSVYGSKAVGGCAVLIPTTLPTSGLFAAAVIGLTVLARRRRRNQA